MDKSKIILLLGMPASGKSSVGRLLAQKLNFTFVDLDREIETFFGCDIPEIFRSFGEEYFRSVERKMLQKTLKDIGRNTVLALGGGTPVYLDNIQLISNPEYFSIFLRCDLDTLAERLGKDGQVRPLILPKVEIGILKNLADQRTPIYEKAILHINADGPLSKVVDEILSHNKLIKYLSH